MNKEYERWLASSELLPELREELTGLDEREIEERFYTSLEFGTAGLRGILGAGPNRMNIHVVRRASLGLAGYVRCFEGGAARGVAIAYDSRKNSELFALEAAKTLAAAGVRAHIFPSLRPVPLLSFAVRKLNCIAGIVITASHNPPEYNGYKVYWEDGGQCAPAAAEAIYARMCENDYFGIPVMEEAEARGAGLIETISSDVDEAYYRATASLMQWPELSRGHGGDIKLVYTPLHGAGLVPVTEMLRRAGFSNVFVVPEQEKPNPAFPTLKAPNPENPEAFDLGIRLADRTGADVILATDPDSDRLGVAVRERNGSFRTLSGNMIGSLLLHYMLSSMQEKGELPSDGFAVKSLVSTRMAEAICARFKIKCYDVPTGFRFISEKINDAERSGSGTFIFGFEESYGFLAGGFSRDKDAVCAALLVAEAAAYYSREGKTLSDVLRDMGEIYGHFGERVASYTLSGMEGLERIASAMASLRREPPRAFSGIPVETFEDMLSGELRSSDGRRSASAVFGVNVLRYSLPGGAWICVRPSGTEPKLKLYVGANAPTARTLDKLLTEVFDSADVLMKGLLG